jgi:hypothetical protein
MFEAAIKWIRLSIVQLFSSYFVRTDGRALLVPVYLQGEYGEIALCEKATQDYFPASRYFKDENDDDLKLKILLRYEMRLGRRATVWNDRREEVEIEC